MAVDANDASGQPKVQEGKVQEGEKEEKPEEKLPGQSLQAVFLNAYYLVASPATIRIALGEIVWNKDPTYHAAFVMPTAEARDMAKLILSLSDEWFKDEAVEPEAKDGDAKS